MSSHKVLAVLACLATLPLALCAEQGGLGHYIPGMTSSFIDGLPYDPGFVYKNMSLYYGGEASGKKSLPLGLNLAAGVDADLYANIHMFGYQSDLEIFGGRYAAALAVPYVRLDIDVNGTLSRNPRRSGRIIPIRLPTSKKGGTSDRAEGLGDLILAPVNLVWKKGDLTYDTHLYIYAPTGEYDKNDLANVGLNYWTFEPGFALSYLGSKNGIEASLFGGIDFNTKNQDTDYQTGEQVHLETTLAQHFPLGKGFGGVGVNAFYYEQITGDSGDGAVLGDFKGKSYGVGPVLSYITTIGDSNLALELKWLPELEVENRLEGDYVWFKAAVAF